MYQTHCSYSLPMFLLDCWSLPYWFAGALHRFIRLTYELCTGRALKGHGTTVYSSLWKSLFLWWFILQIMDTSVWKHPTLETSGLFGTTPGNGVFTHSVTGSVTVALCQCPLKCQRLSFSTAALFHSRWDSFFVASPQNRNHPKSK